MLQTKEKKKSEQIFSVILTVLLLAFLGLVFYVNLSCNPEYYDGDIYADIEYAKQAWKAKSLFPQNWVFGNQTYVVATPALAAIIYGIMNNAVLAMAIASCIMTVLIVLTYDWLMKPLFSYNERTVGFLFMAGLILIKDHIATGVRGSQLFFTMASYYSCYVITAFVVYGCYIRLRQKSLSKRHLPVVILAVALSFGTGMQSLRQMTIMVLPLIACELIEIILDTVRNKKLKFSLSSLFAAAIFLFNILGVFVMKTIHIEQISIYGETQLSFELNIKNLISETITAVLCEVIPIFQSPDNSNIKNLILPAISFPVMFAAFIINIFKQVKNRTEEYDLTLNITLILSCASIFAISILTSLNTRDVYYFMFFPLLAQSIATILKSTKKFCFTFESVIAVTFAAILLYRCVGTVKEIQKGTDPKNTSYQIANYLTDNGYEALYHLSGFNWRYYLAGEDVVVASGDRLCSIRIKSVCFWEDSPNLKYLCIKDSYKLYPDEKSIYLFNEKDLAEAKEYCEKYGIEISIVKQFEDRYLCKLSPNLIAFSEKKGQHEQQN